MESCKLEPNLGIHDYYQAKTKEKLKGKQWLCFGENLVISDQDAENLVHSKGILILPVHFIKRLRISVFISQLLRIIKRNVNMSLLR